MRLLNQRLDDAAVLLTELLQLNPMVLESRVVLSREHPIELLLLVPESVLLHNNRHREVLHELIYQVHLEISQRVLFREVLEDRISLTSRLLVVEESGLGLVETRLRFIHLVF